MFLNFGWASVCLSSSITKEPTHFYSMIMIFRRGRGVGEDEDDSNDDDEDADADA